MSNNEILAAGSYYSDQFEFINKELRQHVKLANNEIENVKDKVNELVVIVHDDNPDWKLKRICDYIAGKNDDLEEYGFSSRTIYNYLNEKNRQLVDTKVYKRKKGDSKNQKNVIEPSHESVHGNVPEQSSTTIDPNQNGSTSDSTPAEQEDTTTAEEPAEEIIYDPGLLDKHIEEIAKLKEENDKLKMERIPTRSHKLDFRYDVEFTDEMYLMIKANSGICSLIATFFPDKGDGYIRFDKEKIQEDIKKTQKNKGK